MGVVAFATEDGERRIGVRFGDRIVEVEAELDGGVETEGERWTRLEELWDRARQAADSDATELSTYSREAVTLEAPISPGKVVRLEGCYEQDLSDEGFNPHVEAPGLNALDWPSLWVGPTSSVSGPSSPVVIPDTVSDVRPGVELVLVVGQGGRHLTPDTALESIAGCTFALSLAAHDELPGLEGYKMFDSFLQLGPEVLPLSGIDVASVELGVEIDGESADVRSTAGWRFDPGELVAEASAVMTLEPGDVIATGDPTRIDTALSEGMEVSAWGEGMGRTTAVVAREEDTA